MKFMVPIKRVTLVLIMIAGLCIPGRSQLNNTLYFMHGVPQISRINPAHQPRCGFYLGFPGLAPIRAEFSSSSLGYGDIILKHPTQDSLITFLHPLGDKDAFLGKLKPINFLASDFSTSLLSFGFRTGIGFFSVDVTTRIDGSIYYPGDLAGLLLKGAEEGATYNFDGIGTDLSLYEEMSLGWSLEISDNLQVGVRAKMLLGVANISTTRSDLSLTTSQDAWNIHADMIYNLSIPFADVEYTDGMVDSIAIAGELEEFDPSVLPKFIFNSNNLGAGIDLGVNFRPIDPLMLSVSVTDLGFINWKDGIQEAGYALDYEFTGLEVNPFEFSEEYSFGDHLDSTFSELADSLSGSLTFTSGGTYVKRLNTKIFAGASYFITPKFNLGILSRTDFLNGKISQQVTASANVTTGRFINLSLSYSYKNAYLKNVGAGLSLNLGPANLYIISDNALNLIFWPQEARSVNFWFGMNMVFGYRKYTKPEYNDKPLVY